VLVFGKFFMTCLLTSWLKSLEHDGAGPFRFFLGIRYLPLFGAPRLPALFVNPVSISGWNQYLWPLLIHHTRFDATIVTASRKMLPLPRTNWPEKMASGLRWQRAFSDWLPTPFAVVVS